MPDKKKKKKKDAESGEVDAVVMCLGDYEHTVTIKNNDIYKQIQIYTRNIDKTVNKNFTIEFDSEGNMCISKFNYGTDSDHIYVDTCKGNIELS